MIDLRAIGAPSEPYLIADFALGVGGSDRVDDTFLAAALRGATHPNLRAIADGSLAIAQEKYGKLDCAAALPMAHEATILYLQTADPTDAAIAGSLKQALAIELLCADGAGDRSGAQAAANRLRALGASDATPPTGVPAATWSRYPEVDGTVNVLPAAVKIETDPVGARVWIDLVDAGKAPIERGLTPGRHLVSTSAPGRVRTVTEIVVKEREPFHTHLALAAEPLDRWATVRQTVASAREQKQSLDAGAVARVMRDTGLAIAVVLEPGGGARVWVRHETGGQDEIARLTTVDKKSVSAAVKKAVEHLAGGDLTAEHDDPAGREEAPKAKKRPWWVYGLLVGGVLVGAGFVYLLDAGDDTQRIEVHFP